MHDIHHPRSVFVTYGTRLALRLAQASRLSRRSVTPVNPVGLCKGTSRGQSLDSCNSSGGK